MHPFIGCNLQNPSFDNFGNKKMNEKENSFGGCYSQMSHLGTYVVCGKEDVCPQYLRNTLGGKVFNSVEEYDRYINYVNDICEKRHMVEMLKVRDENSSCETVQELKEYVPIWKRTGPLNSTKSSKWCPLVEKVDVLSKNSNGTLSTIVCSSCLKDGKSLSFSLIGVSQTVLDKEKVAKLVFAG